MSIYLYLLNTFAHKMSALVAHIHYFAILYLPLAGLQITSRAGKGINEMNGSVNIIIVISAQ